VWVVRELQHFVMHILWWRRSQRNDLPESILIYLQNEHLPYLRTVNLIKSANLNQKTTTKKRVKVKIQVSCEAENSTNDHEMIETVVSHLSSLFDPHSENSSITEILMLSSVSSTAVNTPLQSLNNFNKFIGVHLMARKKKDRCTFFSKHQGKQKNKYTIKYLVLLDHFLLRFSPFHVCFSLCVFLFVYLSVSPSALSVCLYPYVCLYVRLSLSLSLSLTHTLPIYRFRNKGEF